MAKKRRERERERTFLLSALSLTQPTTHSQQSSCLSSDAEVFVDKRRLSTRVGARTCEATRAQRARVPTGLQFLRATVAGRGSPVGGGRSRASRANLKSRDDVPSNAQPCSIHRGEDDWTKKKKNNNKESRSRRKKKERRTLFFFSGWVADTFFLSTL